jgi:hypothetical protein
MALTSITCRSALARDCGVSVTQFFECTGLFVSKLTPTACGQNQKPITVNGPDLDQL